MTSRAQPGAGLVLFVGTSAAVASFFVWALQPPALERVWELELELAAGERGPLTAAEFELLQATLHRYPLLASDMLDGAAAGVVGAESDSAVERGWAYLVRTRRDRPAVFEAQRRNDTGGSVEIHVRTSGALVRGTLAADAPFSWRLPDTGPFPQLVEVRFAPSPDRTRSFAPVMMKLRGVP